MSTCTSFSSGRGDLPGQNSNLDSRRGELRRSFEDNRDPMIAAQRADLAKTEAQRRASQMVKQDRPKPVQRPSPGLALGPDGAAFSARWRAEHAAASRDARKAEFKAARRAQSQFHTHARTHDRGDDYER